MPTERQLRHRAARLGLRLASYQGVIRLTYQAGRSERREADAFRGTAAECDGYLAECEAAIAHRLAERLRLAA